MSKYSRIEAFVLDYMEKKKGPVTFKELYSNSQFSEQGIRNAVYRLMKKGIIKKEEYKGTGKAKVCFVLSK